jgi:hypothetical protein
MIPSDVHFAPLTEVARRIARGDWRSAEVTEHMLARIGAIDGQWRSYLHVLANRAMDQARAADAEIARGIRRGPLHGVPVALKDLCDTTFAPTTGRHADAAGPHPGAQRHHRGPDRRGRGRHAGQAEDDRRRLYRASPG